jgi:hypothetical protein
MRTELNPHVFPDLMWYAARPDHPVHGGANRSPVRSSDFSRYRHYKSAACFCHNVPAPTTPPEDENSENSTKNMSHGRHFYAIIRIGRITDLVTKTCTQKRRVHHAQPPTNTQSPISRTYRPSPSHVSRITQHVPGKGVDNCFQETQGGPTPIPNPQYPISALHPCHLPPAMLY